MLLTKYNLKHGNLSSTLRSLRLSVYDVVPNQWLLLQRNDFDLCLNGEPYHSLQLLLHTQHGHYYVRVLGKTRECGQVAEWAELDQLCLDTFQNVLACVGHVEDTVNRARLQQLALNDEAVRTDFPVRRVIAKTCQRIVRRQHGVPDRGSGMCQKCRELTRLDNVKLEVKGRSEPSCPALSVVTEVQTLEPETPPRNCSAISIHFQPRVMLERLALPDVPSKDMPVPNLPESANLSVQGSQSSSHLENEYASQSEFALLAGKGSNSSRPMENVSQPVSANQSSCHMDDETVSQSETALPSRQIENEYQPVPTNQLSCDVESEDFHQSELSDTPNVEAENIKLSSTGRMPSHKSQNETEKQPGTSDPPSGKRSHSEDQDSPNNKETNTKRRRESNAVHHDPTCDQSRNSTCVFENDDCLPESTLENDSNNEINDDSEAVTEHDNYVAIESRTAQEEVITVVSDKKIPKKRTTKTARNEVVKENDSSHQPTRRSKRMKRTLFSFQDLAFIVDNNEQNLGKKFYHYRVKKDFKFRELKKADGKYHCTQCNHQALPNPRKMWIHMHKKHLLDRHTCSYCSKEFNFPSEMLSHIQKEHLEKKEIKFKCPTCKKVNSSDETGFYGHLYHCVEDEELPAKGKKKSIKPNHQMPFYRQRLTSKYIFPRTADGNFFCSTCSKVLLHYRYAWAHMHRLHQLDLYNCSYCPQGFNFPSEVVQHTEEAHQDTNKRSVKCPVCKVSCMTNDLQYFKVHLQNCITYEKLPTDTTSRPPPKPKSEHKGRPTIKCPHCVAHMKDFEGLAEHMKTHTGERKPGFQCQECDRAFFSVDSLKYHKKTHLLERGLTHDEKGKPLCLTCEVCGVALRERGTLRCHMFNVHGIEEEERPQVTRQCDKCGFVSKKAKEFYYHYIRMHTDRYKCKECDKVYNCASSLRQHVQLKHGDGETKAECDVCGKKVVARRLANHKRQHTGEKPYKCPHCFMAYGSNTSMWHHVYAKHPEKCKPPMKRKVSKSKKGKGKCKYEEEEEKSSESYDSDSNNEEDADDPSTCQKEVADDPPALQVNAEGAEEL